MSALVTSSVSMCFEAGYQIVMRCHQNGSEACFDSVCETVYVICNPCEDIQLVLAGVGYDISARMVKVW